jgi:hypothetical protein
MSPQSAQLREGGKFQLPNWNSWSINNWGQGPVTLELNGSYMLWNFTESLALVSISYNGTVTQNNPGGIKVPTGVLPVLDVAFDYRASKVFDSGMQVVIPSLGSDLQVLSVTTSQSFPSSSDWNRATYHVTLPAGTAYFTARIQTEASRGWIELENVEMRIRFLEVNSQVPFNSLVPVAGNQTLSLLGHVRLQYQGTGSICSNNSVFRLNSTNLPTWSPEIESAGSVWVSGDMKIITIVVSHDPLATISDQVVTNDGMNLMVPSRTSVVFANTFAPGYALTDGKRTFDSVPTIEGMNLFENVTPGNYRIVFSHLQVIQGAYSVSVALSLILVVVFSGAIARTRISLSSLMQQLRFIRRAMNRLINWRA